MARVRLKSCIAHDNNSNLTSKPHNFDYCRTIINIDGLLSSSGYD